jgi:hypothetical protein
MSGPKVLKALLMRIRFQIDISGAPARIWRIIRGDPMEWHRIRQIKKAYDEECNRPK